MLPYNLNFIITENSKYIDTKSQGERVSFKQSNINQGCTDFKTGRFNLNTIISAQDCEDTQFIIDLWYFLGHIADEFSKMEEYYWADLCASYTDGLNQQFGLGHREQLVKLEHKVLDKRAELFKKKVEQKKWIKEFQDKIKNMK